MKSNIEREGKREKKWRKGKERDRERRKMVGKNSILKEKERLRKGNLITEVKLKVCKRCGRRRKGQKKVRKEKLGKILKKGRNARRNARE